MTSSGGIRTGVTSETDRRLKQNHLPLSNPDYSTFWMFRCMMGNPHLTVSLSLSLCVGV